MFRIAGPAFKASRLGHLSLCELKVMSAIEACRTAALGGHVEGCDDCGHLRIAYNSCRNRHCPRCQGAAARDWLAEREADLLPVGYFHVVFTLPAEIAAIAFQNKRAVYDLLFRTASETMTTIAADPKHLGARIGLTAVLHTWGSAMTHHPHLHMIVPGGGLSLDGSRWITSRPAFLLPVRVLGALFRRLFLEGLGALHASGGLAFHGSLAHLAEPRAFASHLAPVRKKGWVVYSKPPFAGPKAVLSYLSRYTHRVAISSRRIAAFDGTNVTFRVKDYRKDGAARHRTLTLEAGEFIRRFLIHILPKGFHRIRHYGFLTGPNRKAGLERIRTLRGAPPIPQPSPDEPEASEQSNTRPPCPCCSGSMRIVGVFLRWRQPRGPPSRSSPDRECPP
ncbi:IS91 family transposase [Fulvimarina sp. MAC8]|uniref:IS91 family transposase n=1 Tax=Fulvimarina sp. MAC8 TaxID=3162874 RepID=UPI0032EAA7DE